MLTAPARAARALLAPFFLLALAPAAAVAAGAWLLVEAGKQGAITPVSNHATLTECLDELKTREETQRAYFRAANESSPQDQLPLPSPAVSLRCLPEK